MIALSLSTTIITGCGSKEDKSVSTDNTPTQEVKKEKPKKEDKKDVDKIKKDTVTKTEENKINDKSKKPVEQKGENSKKYKEQKSVEKPVTKPVQKPAPKPVLKPEEKPQPPKVEKPDNNISTKEIYASITKGLEAAKQIPMDGNLFKDNYGIDISILDDYNVMMPMMIVRARECAIFKVKDVKDSQKVLDGINKRLNTLENTWKQYLPDQYELVKNKKIIQKEKYILFVIDEHEDKIVQNFNNIIK